MTVAALAFGAGSALAAPTKSAFIRSGDALRSRVQRELAPVRKRAEAARSLPKAQQWAAVTQPWTDQIRIQGRFNGRFQAIGVPAGASTARGLVLGLERGLELARRVRNAFAAKSTSALATALPGYLGFTISLNRRVAAYSAYAAASRHYRQKGGRRGLKARKSG